MRCSTERGATRLRSRLLIAVIAGVALVGGLVAPADPRPRVEWLLPAGQPVPHGAAVVGELPATGTVIVSATTAPPGSARLDAELRWHADSLSATDPLADRDIDPALDQLGVPSAWRAGHRGEGALIALIDTGVAPIDALDGAVVGEVDFTGGGGGDGYGHGTFLASLIAGRASAAPGVAPEAGIISLKVGGDDGETTLGTVLTALEWLGGPGRELGVRLATLAVGVDPDSDAGAVLDIAAQHLGSMGTLVITASGNSDDQALSSPATSPGTLSAGALDADGEADFSGRGTDRVGIRQPDVLAPGVEVAGHAPPDSVIVAGVAAEHGDSERIARGQVRGTGTSVSAALTTGVAALASAANPGLDGPELGGYLGKDSGGTTLNAPRVLAAVDGAETRRPGPDLLPNGRQRPVHPHTLPEDVPLPPVAQWTPAQWNGTKWVVSLDTADTGSRGRGAGSPPSERPDSIRWNAADWKSPTGNPHARAAPAWPRLWHDSIRWNSIRWNSIRWNSIRWNSIRWNSIRWNSIRWNDWRLHDRD